VALITVKNVAKLRSRVVREKLKKSEPGNGSPPAIPDWIRKLGGGLLRNLGGGLKRLVGWGFSGLVRLGVVSFDSIWGGIVQGTQSIIDFDFAQSDAAIKRQIDQNNKSIVTSLAGSLGELVGLGVVGLATISVGGIIGGVARGSRLAVATMKFPVLQSSIGADLLEEANQELVSGLRNFLSISATAVASNLFLLSVLTIRRNEWLGQKTVKTDERPNGSIAAKIDRKIEKIPEFWREPLQAFISGVGSGIENGGYVIARSFDSAVAESAFANRRQGEEFTIEIVPHGNSSDPAKKSAGEEIGPIRISGTQDEIAQSVPEVMGLAPVIAGAGNPAIPATWALRPGSDRPQLVIRYRAQNKSASTHTLHVPHYSGPRAPKFPDYDAGQWLGLWTLSDGSKLQVYASTEREAGVMMRALSKGVPRKFKTGRPRYVNSDRRILKKAMKYVGCAYYANGIEGGVTWKGYRN
jgi:hypothetical protein